VSTAPKLSRSQLAAVVAGNALEFYDFLIFGFFAVQIGTVFFPVKDSTGSLLLTLATFGVGFLTRPLGGALIGRLGDRIGRKPFVITTFICFALFPLAVIFASSFILLVFAFVIGGLREIGEPSRKAMIVDFAEENVRARSVGLYYLIRSLSISPAAAIGGLLWKIAPEVPFVIAGIIGLIGTLVFAMTVEERYAS